MKHTRLLLLAAAMTFGLMTTQAKTIQYNKAISAELPDDFNAQTVDKANIRIDSEDRKTTFFLHGLSTEDMPSTWKMPKEYDEHFLKVDEMKQIKKKRSPFWILTQNYYRRWYVMESGDTLISDTRLVSEYVVLNTCIIDHGQRTEAIEQYLDTIHSEETAMELFWRTFKNGRLFWIVIALIITGIGGVIMHQEKGNFKRGLLYGLAAAACIVPVCLVTMYGAWSTWLIYCLIAFLLGAVATWTGFYLEPNTD